MDKRFAIGNFICELRQEKGLTQKELGDMLGVTNKAVSKWENGASMPRMEYLHDLAAILGCTEEELFLGHRIEKDKEGHSEPAEESYISVVQRCDSCRHEGKFSFRHGFKCKKCGAKIKLKPFWFVLIGIVFLLMINTIYYVSEIIATDLLIPNFYAELFPNMEEVAFFNALHEHFPKIEIIGSLARLQIFFIVSISCFIILRLLSFLLRKKVKYRIVGYPHTEDGKIVF